MSAPPRPDPPLAYENTRFMESEEARPLRILAEYSEPLKRFRAARVCETIVFFGSARLAEDGPLGRYYREARELARLVTLWAQSLGTEACRYVVCTGGGGGIMEAANRGAIDAGGLSIGLNIALPFEQHVNRYITPGLAFQFHYFFMRKLWFAHLARALVVFPGGFGTLDEMTEVLTLIQTGKTRRIPVILVGTSFWRGLIAWMRDQMVPVGMIAANDLDIVQMIDEPANVVEAIFSFYEARNIVLSDTDPQTGAFL